MNAKLITMAGPGDVDFSNLSNFEAGILTLAMIDRVYPGIKFGQLRAVARGETPVRMAGWFTDMKKGVTGSIGSVKDGIGDVLKDSFDATAGAGGDFLRLVTSKNVIDGANSSYSSFTESGGIGGAFYGDMFTGGGDGEEGGVAEAGKGFMDWIVNLGASSKSKSIQSGAADMNIPGGILPWALGGVMVLFLLARRNG